MESRSPASRQSLSSGRNEAAWGLHNSGADAQFGKRCRAVNTRRAIVAGLVASLVMGMVEMIYEALAGGGFWSPVVYIGATVLRGLQAVRPPVAFDFWGVILGLMGHMMNSVILGSVFVALFRGAQTRGAQVTWGAFYGLVIFFIMWYGVVPVVDPVLRQLNTSAFAIAHIMWGGALGLLVPRTVAADLRVTTT